MLKKLLLIGFCFLFTIILFEIFLRYSPFSNGISPVVYDKDIGMWHKKNFDSYIVKECYNNKYFFDEEGRIKNNYTYDSTKKDVVILGDSQIEALMVENKKIIHNSLYKELNGKFNILNYGLSGTSVTQQLQILKSKVDLNRVDTVVQFIFLENDLNDLNFKTKNSVNRPKVNLNFDTLESYTVIQPISYTLKEKIRDFLGNFELYNYLNKNIYFYFSLFKKQLSEVTQSINNNFNIENEEFKWQQLEGSIYQINKLLKNNKINYHVIIYSQLEFNNDFTDRRKKLEEFLTNQKINSVNLAPLLKVFSLENQLAFECDGHWNGNTHKYIANYLKKELFK